MNWKNYKNFEKKLWKNDIHDILYALESKKIVNLSIEKGNIKQISYNPINLKKFKLIVSKPDKININKIFVALAECCSDEKGSG